MRSAKTRLDEGAADAGAADAAAAELAGAADVATGAADVAAGAEDAAGGLDNWISRGRTRQTGDGGRRGRRGTVQSGIAGKADGPGDRNGLRGLSQSQDGCGTDDSE